MRIADEYNSVREISLLRSQKLSLTDLSIGQASLNKVYFDNSALNNLWEEKEPSKSFLIERFRSRYLLD